MSMTLTAMYDENEELKEKVEKLEEENYFLIKRVEELTDQVSQLASDNGYLNDNISSLSGRLEEAQGSWK